ncbi:PglL family O-oligosaccharyltransferase [Ramlibacter sp. MMS24-I3-19]|uniref:PglL family O-oligosaccharyltransferase n=1 Tax=Ramlibacter sp. MMS24-I3-19 TaxID=3416606 RepID=UPI003CFDEECF
MAAAVRWTPSPRFFVVAAGAAAVSAWAWLSHPEAHVDPLYLAAGMVLIVLAAAVAQDGLLRESLVSGLLGAALVSAVLGLLQYFGASPGLAPWVDIAPAGEAYANLRQTNQYATLCWIGMAVLLCTLSRIRWSAALAAAVLLAGASAASVSRTGLLQGITLVVLMALWPAPDRRRRLVLCATAAVAYVAASMLLPALFDAVTGTLPSRTLWARISEGGNCHSRRVLWLNVLQLIAERPWVGWGWGGLDEAHFMADYPGARFCEILDNAHNLPLHLAVELGVPVAVLVTLAGLAWIWSARPWRESAAQRQLGWAILAVIGVHSMLEYPLWYGPFQIAAGAALGWLLPSSPTITRNSGRSVLGRGLAALLLLAVGAAAWDYWRVSQVYLPPEQRRAEWRRDPLGEAKRSWLFGAQARFAELTLTPVTRANAPQMARLAREMLRYSPEPRTVERLVEAETLLGHEGEAVAMLARYKAAFPDEYQRWRTRTGAGDGFSRWSPQD